MQPYNYKNGVPHHSNNQKRNSGIYTRTLFGENIHENPVPVWTADKSQNPFVSFCDPMTGKAIGISKDKLSYGFLALGAPGSGKTNFYNMVLERLIATQQNNDIIIIFDTKGDYYRLFWDRIPQNERIVIGVSEAYAKVTSYHNIFGEIMPRGNDGRLVYTTASDTYALNISKQLFQKMHSDTQPIFPEMASQLFAAVLIYFMRTYWRSNPEKLNNRALIDYLSQNTNDSINSILQRDYMKDQKRCIDYIANKSNQTQGVNSYIGTILNMFLGPFAKSDPSREFSMRSIIKEHKRKVVFVEYDLELGMALSPIYGILLDTAMSCTLGGRHEEKNSVYMLLDEMLQLPMLMHLPDMLNFGRSEGAKVLCGLQNLSGLDDLYGEAGAKNVLSSFQNMITFHLTDYDTRQFVINRLGTNYQNYSFSAQQQNINVQREGHTVEDYDLLSLKLGQAVVSLKDESPFLFTMPKY